MKEKFYPFRASEDYLFYYFESRSEERTIPKAVQFEKIGADIYNLGFGDLHEGHDFNDVVTSNNGDMRKVMATVVQIVIVFLSAYPNQQVYFAGSSPSRTRLYRAILSREAEHWSEVFDIKGIVKGKPEPFQSSMHCEAFLISHIENTYEARSQQKGHL